MCFFFHLEQWEKRPQEVLLGSSNKEAEDLKDGTLGSHGKFDVSFLQPQNSKIDTKNCHVLKGVTLQGTNISHLGNRKIIFKMPFLGGYVSSLEGI